MKPSLLAILLLPMALAHQSTPSTPAEERPEAVIEKLYELVTFEAGETPDWDAVRALFVDEAAVVLRTAPKELSVFTVDGFVADFVRFIEGQGVAKTGFTERILGMKTVFEYRDLAQVLVLFDSHIPGSSRPPSQGIDSFSLIRGEQGWKIVSITNERPTPEQPIPMELFEEER